MSRVQCDIVCDVLNLVNNIFAAQKSFIFSFGTSVTSFNKVRGVEINKTCSKGIGSIKVKVKKGIILS